MLYMAKKVLFILTPSFREFSFPPLPVGSILSYLRGLRYDVKFVDFHAILSFASLPLSKKNLLKKEISPLSMYQLTEDVESLRGSFFYKFFLKHLPDDEYDLVAISCSFGQPECYSLSIIIGKACKDKFKTQVIIGGESQQYGMLKRLYPRAYNVEAVDYVASGPGEPTLYHLLLDRQANKIDNVPGLSFFRNNQIFHNDFGKEINCLNPDFKDIDFNKYKPTIPVSIQKKSQINHTNKILPYRFIIGCPHKCSFCKESNSSFLEIAKPKMVVNNIKNLVETLHIDNFYFLNSTLNINDKFFHDFCEELLSRNISIKWSDCVRPDSFDINSAKIAKRSGALRLVFGFESGSRNIQNMIDKKLDLSQLAKAIKASHDVGIWTALEVIVGFPNETWKDLDNTINFLTNCKQWIDEIWVNTFFLDIRSKMFNNPNKYGIDDVIDQRKLPALNPFEIPYPPILFHDNRYDFTGQMNNAEEMKLKLVQDVGIYEGDGSDISSFDLLLYFDKKQVKNILNRISNK